VLLADWIQPTSQTPRLGFQNRHDKLPQNSLKWNNLKQLLCMNCNHLILLTGWHFVIGSLSLFMMMIRYWTDFIFWWSLVSLRSCMVCTLCPGFLGWSKQGGWDGRGMWRAWGRLGVHTTFWLGGLKGGDH
jgi:hypothetical protein